MIFLGILGVMPHTSRAVANITGPITATGRSVLNICFPPEMVDLDGDGDADVEVPARALRFYTKVGWCTHTTVSSTVEPGDAWSSPPSTVPRGPSSDSRYTTDSIAIRPNRPRCVPPFVILAISLNRCALSCLSPPPF